MHKTIVAVLIALAAGVLGGCTGTLSGGSPLPVTQMRPAETMGGLPASRLRHHDNDQFGGLPASRAHRLDQFGGLPGKKK